MRRRPEFPSWTNCPDNSFCVPATLASRTLSTRRFQLIVATRTDFLRLPEERKAGRMPGFYTKAQRRPGCECSGRNVEGSRFREHTHRRHLSLDDRIQIENLHDQDTARPDIARTQGVHRRTICRELCRGRWPSAAPPLCAQLHEPLTLGRSWTTPRPFLRTTNRLQHNSRIEQCVAKMGRNRPDESVQHSNFVDTAPRPHVPAAFRRPPAPLRAAVTLESIAVSAARFRRGHLLATGAGASTRR